MVFSWKVKVSLGVDANSEREKTTDAGGSSEELRPSVQDQRQERRRLHIPAGQGMTIARDQTGAKRILIVPKK